MKKIMMLLLTAPILACGPVGPYNQNTDGGDGDDDVTLIHATLSMSLPNSWTGDFLVNDNTACTNVNSCEYDIRKTGTYEITGVVENSLCVPKTALFQINGDMVNLDLPCGLAPNGTYIDGYDRRIEFTTTVVGNQIIMHGFLQDVDAVVDDNHFIMDQTFPSGTREVFEGIISDDLCLIEYHVQGFNASGNLIGENHHTLTSTDC